MHINKYILAVNWNFRIYVEICYSFIVSFVVYNVYLCIINVDPSIEIETLRKQTNKLNVFINNLLIAKKLTME